MVALNALVLGIQESHRWHWTSPWTIGSIAAGAVLLAVLVRTQLRESEPLLDVRPFLDPAYVADAVVLYCAQFASIA